MDNEQAKVEDLEGKSQEELMQLEDEMVAGEAGKADESAPAQKEPEVTPKVTPEGAKSTDEAEAGDVDAEADAIKKAEADTDANAANQKEDEEVTHVSPPSKWAAERQEKRDLQERLNTAEAKTAENGELKTELDEVKSELEWIKTAIQSKGVDLPAAPMDMFSEQKITDIRDEYGDEIADMFQATAAILQKQNDANAAPAQKEPDTVKTEVDNDLSQQDKSAADDNNVDPALAEAIDDNDDLTYWRENSAKLWDRAVAKDTELLKDPEYEKLSYSERFATVVESVKKDVTDGATPGKGTDDKGGDGAPPSFSDTPTGVTPPPSNSDAVDRVLAADTSEKQMQIYSGLSEAERDKVDIALNI